MADVLSLREAKDHLNIEGDEQDALVSEYLAAAMGHIADRIGPLEVVSVSERCTAVNGTLLLSELPALSLTSAAAVGGSGGIDVAAVHVDSASGVVSLDAGAISGTYDVVYDAGREGLPANLKLAVKELLRHLWKSSQRRGANRRGTPDAEVGNVPGFLMPYAVESLLEADDQGFGFA